MNKILDNQTMIETSEKNYIVNAECQIMPEVENSWKVQVWTPIYVNGYFLHRVPKTIKSGLSRIQAQRLFNRELNKLKK